MNGHVKSPTYRPSPIPSEGLGIQLQLTFLCGQRETLDIMNAFINSLYHWNYTGIVSPEENKKNDEENTDDENFLRTSSTSNECDETIIFSQMCCCCCSRFISSI